MDHYKSVAASTTANEDVVLAGPHGACIRNREGIIESAAPSTDVSLASHAHRSSGSDFCGVKRAIRPDVKVATHRQAGSRHANNDGIVGRTGCSADSDGPVRNH